MADRENSPAYAALPRSARRVFAAIERAIGDKCCASVSYVGFGMDHHVTRMAVSPSLKLLDHLGLIQIEPGRRLVNVFRFSNRWRTIDEVEVLKLRARLGIALAIRVGHLLDEQARPSLRVVADDPEERQ